MSLQISVYRFDENGTPVLLDSEPGDDVFGFESARRKLWGADILRELGLTLLPQLGDGYSIFAEGNDLDQLEHEADLIIQNIDLIDQQTSYGDKYLLNYMQNLLKAINIARSVKGRVVI